MEGTIYPYAQQGLPSLCAGPFKTPIVSHLVTEKLPQSLASTISLVGTEGKAAAPAEVDLWELSLSHGQCRNCGAMKEGP